MRAFSGRFGLVPAAWLDRPDIGLAEISVLTSLSVFADQDGWCHPSQQTIAKQLDRSRQWVNGILAKLVKLGLIEKHRRFAQNGGELSAIYRIRYDASLPSEPPAPEQGDEETPVSPSTPPVSGLTPPVDTPTPPVSPADTNSTNLTKESLSGPRAGRKISDRDQDKTVPPADWKPTEADVEWARQRHPDIDVHEFAEQFVLSCQANGYRYFDHSAAFRHWLIEHAGRVKREDARRGGGARTHEPDQSNPDTEAGDVRQSKQQRRRPARGADSSDRVQRNAATASALLSRLREDGPPEPSGDGASPSVRRLGGSGSG